MGKVDPNEAPEGYMAAEEDLVCLGCSFIYPSKECIAVSCGGAYRKDGRDVIFIKKPGDGKATASWPYDSEGTPV